MNNDLISREALKEDLIKFFPIDCLEGIESKTLFNQILTDINNAPTVDTTCPHCNSGYAQGYSDGYLKGIEERSTGDWIIEENNKYYPEGRATCSQCGYKMDVQRWEWLPALRWYLKPNFCPECGADMRKEKKE